MLGFGQGFELDLMADRPACIQPEYIQLHATTEYNTPTIQMSTERFSSPM